MKLNELSQAKDPDLIASVAAMKQAAAMLRQAAIQTGTAIVVYEDQKIIRRTAAELQATFGNESIMWMVNGFKYPLIHG